MCVCVCVCVFLFVFEWVCLYVCVCLCLCMFVCVCVYVCACCTYLHIHVIDNELSPPMYHPVIFTRSTLHSLTLPVVLQCHKEFLCLRVLSALLWIRRHWLRFPWRLADLICLLAVLVVTQVLITQGIPLNLHILFREHIPETLSMVSQCVSMLCIILRVGMS